MGQRLLLPLKQLLNQLPGRFGRVSYEAEVKLLLLFLLLFTTLLGFTSDYLLLKINQTWNRSQPGRQAVLEEWLSTHWERQPPQNSRDLQQLVRDLVVFTGPAEVTFIPGKDSLLPPLRFPDPPLAGGNKGDQIVFTLPGKQGSLTLWLPANVAGVPVGLVHWLWLLKIIAVGLLLVFLPLLWRYIFAPLKTISTQVQALPVPVPPRHPKSDAEVAIASFQQMIAELKTQQAELAALNALLHDRSHRLAKYNDQILRQMNLIAVICDAEGTVTHWNHRAESTFDLAANRVIDQPFQQALRSVPAVVAVIEQARAGHSFSQPRELRVPLAGREAIFMVTSAQIQDEADGLLGVCVLGTDVTELRRLQEELVTKEKLAALGEMAAGLAHQLRNALAAISGFGKLLHRVAPEESQVKSVAAEILREAEATAALLDRFLSFAQPQKLAAEVVSAADLWQEVTAAKSVDLKERNISCTVNLPPGLVIQGDLHLLKQVFVNLLQNAIEAVPQNGKIEITGVAGPEIVELAISDNGPGVPKALRTRIFDPFFTTKESGSGLGLSVARKVLELHGGTLTVRDQAGGGARFILTFPRQKATEDDAPLVLASSAPHQ